MNRGIQTLGVSLAILSITFAIWHMPAYGDFITPPPIAVEIVTDGTAPDDFGGVGVLLFPSDTARDRFYIGEFHPAYDEGTCLVEVARLSITGGDRSSSVESSTAVETFTAFGERGEYHGGTYHGRIVYSTTEEYLVPRVVEIRRENAQQGWVNLSERGREFIESRKLSNIFFGRMIE